MIDYDDIIIMTVSVHVIITNTVALGILYAA